MRVFARATVMCFLALAAACGNVDEQLIEGVDATDLDKADGPAYRVTLTAPASLMGGRATTLALTVKDSAAKAVERYDVEHTKKFHLIVVSRDLSYFTHLHPTYRSAGKFTVSWTSPDFDDSYHLFAQFKPAGKATRTILVPLHVPGLSIKTPAPVAPDTVLSNTQGRNTLMVVRPSGGFKKGAATLSFMVHDARTGAMVTDLGTFLGARAHVIGVMAGVNGAVFFHGHDMGDMAGMDHGAHGGAMSSDGELRFDIRFARAGVYRLWVQYNRAGTDVTQVFTVRVSG